MRPRWGEPDSSQTKQRLAKEAGADEILPMRLPSLLLLILGLGLVNGHAATDPKLLLLEQKLGGFEDKDYASAVERMLGEFELRTGVSLKPSSRQRCGLKISSESGIGLSTPKPLVRAVSAALLRRGFAQRAITICDAKTEKMKQAGFLPTLSTADQTFEGYPVIVWEQSVAIWAKEPTLRYENQVLPSPGSPPVAWGDPRASILPRTLTEEVDFWINLPVLSDSKSLGVHGAMAAASLGNISNADRFLENPASAAKAAVEVCAIPKLSRHNFLTILSLERYQVLGGPVFDSTWCRSEKTLLSSANPVIIDFIGLQKINSGRAAGGVETIHPEPPIFEQANSGEIRLGTCRPSDITLVRLSAP
jgi:hypothetical protein